MGIWFSRTIPGLIEEEEAPKEAFTEDYVAMAPIDHKDYIDSSNVIVPSLLAAKGRESLRESIVAGWVDDEVNDPDYVDEDTKTDTFG